MGYQEKIIQDKPTYTTTNAIDTYLEKLFPKLVQKQLNSYITDPITRDRMN